MARTRVHTGVIRTEPENAGWAKRADMQKNYADTGKAVRPRHAPATDQTMATAESMVAAEALAMQALSAFRGKPLMHGTSRVRDISGMKQKTRREAEPRVWLKMHPVRGN